MSDEEQQVQKDDTLPLVEKSHLDMTLEEAIAWWDMVDEKGTSLAGIRALCLVDRYYLLVKVCKRVDMLHPWLYERCREVEKSPDGHLDLWSREHYKSTIITFGGTIQAILRNPEETICIFSNVRLLANKFLGQVKQELESNPLLKLAFPDILYDDPIKQAPQWSVEGGLTVKRKGNPKERTLSAAGLVDGQPIGEHFSLRIYDDVVTDKSVGTPESIAKTTDAYALSQALGKEGGRVWIIGTRYSYADTYEWLLQRGAVIPRIYAVTDSGKADGNLVLFSKKRWDDIQISSTDSVLACQYFQNPIAGQQRMFDVEDLVDYEVRPATVNVYVICDPARSKKKESDNTAIMVWGVDSNLNKYLLDGFNHKMDLQERWTNFSNMYIKWSRQAGVGKVVMGYEEFGAHSDLDYFEEQMKLPNSPRFDIIRVAWPREGGGSKVDRVQRLVPDCKKHKIMLPYPTDMKKLTSNQVRMVSAGLYHRVSQMIKRRDESGNIYDLAEQLRMQFHYFPFGGKKDAIDATARLYDMDLSKPRAPGQPNYIEPDYV